MRRSNCKSFLSLSTLALSMVFAGAAAAQESAPDLMSFAHGTLPISIDTGDADLRVDPDRAIAMIDGNPTGFVVTRKPARESDVVEITFELQTLTRFDRFAVPNVLETPSPSQTFFKSIEVRGSAESSDSGFVTLASGALSTHDQVGEQTALDMAPQQPEVRWVQLRLSGGVNVERETSFFEFSELIGNGSQAAPELSDGFDGIWRGRGVKLELAQDGVNVTGCYDSNATLSGTVDGRVLRALGEDAASIASQFILIATEDGAIQGLRSTNGAPFKLYAGDPSSAAPVCLPPEPVKLGCGSIIHGIGFDYDSADIRASSEPVIASLFDGLASEAAAAIEIIGHSSSEGSEAYNRDLSQRRAESVVSALTDRGLSADTLSATGRGELEPIASNDDEAGRSLNRRVEIRCTN